MRKERKTYHRKDPGKCQAERAQLRSLPAADGETKHGQRHGAAPSQDSAIRQASIERRRRSSKSNQPALSTDARKRARGGWLDRQRRMKDMQERGQADERCY